MKNLRLFDDIIESVPDYLLATMSASKPWFPSGTANGGYEPLNLQELVTRYGTNPEEAIRRYVVDDNPEPEFDGHVFVWCESDSDGISLRTMTFSESLKDKNPQNPYVYSVLKGSVFAYDPDNENHEIAFLREAFQEAWGDPETYDVAISFGAAQRDYARSLATYLRKNNVLVFFDEFSQPDMWGKDGLEYLENIYAKNARFVIMCISESYIERAWPTYERKQVLGREFLSQEEVILPLRFDDVEVPGLPPQYFFLDARHLNAEEVGAIVNEKLMSLNTS